MPAFSFALGVAVVAVALLVYLAAPSMRWGWFAAGAVAVVACGIGALLLLQWAMGRAWH
jgi:hypothetical protein